MFFECETLLSPLPNGNGRDITISLAIPTCKTQVLMLSHLTSREFKITKTQSDLVGHLRGIITV